MSLDALIGMCIEQIQGTVVTQWAMHFFTYMIFKLSQSISAEGKKTIIFGILTQKFWQTN